MKKYMMQSATIGSAFAGTSRKIANTNTSVPNWFRRLADDPASRHILTLTTKEPLIEPSARYRAIIDDVLRETERPQPDPFPF